MRRMRLLVSLLPVALLFSCEVGSKDTIDHGNSMASPTGVELRNGLQNLIEASGCQSLAWVVSLGEHGYMDNALWVMGDDLYAQVRLGSGTAAKTEIHALDLKTGKYKWTLNVPGELDHPPSVSPNRVAFVCGSRAVVVNRTTGARTSSGLYYDLPSWPSATPALTDTTMYVPTYIENKLQTVDLRRGLTGWTYRTRGLVATAPLIAGTGAGHSVIMAAEDGFVVALPARDATEPAPRNESWTARTFGTFDLDPVEHGDLVYIASSDSSLYAFNAIGGSIMWRYISGGEWHGELAVGGDTLFARTDRDWLALDAATGAVKWTAGDLDKFIVRMGDHVIIKTSGGGGYSRRRASDGAEVGHFQSALMKNVPVNSTGDILVFGDGLGTIYALK